MIFLFKYLCTGDRSRVDYPEPGFWVVLTHSFWGGILTECSRTQMVNLEFLILVSLKIFSKPVVTIIILNNLKSNTVVIYSR